MHLLCITSYAQGNQQYNIGKSFITKGLDKYCVTENKGQCSDEVKYYAELPGADISFQQNGIKFSLKEQSKNQEVKTDFAMQLIESNPNAKIIGEEKLAGKLIYNAVSENVNVAANQYKALFYRNIYAGIDLRFKVQENKGIKYEFIVHPGADVNAIKIKWIGADKVSADEKGGLKYFKEDAYITDSKPVSFSEGKPIESSFITNEGITAFSVAEYNHEQDLIIDPVIQWSTYYGSYGPNEFIAKVLPDKFGNVYAMVANTSEYDSKLVTPAFDSIKWSQNYSYYTIVKFDSSGNRMWATFSPYSVDMAVDDSGNVYLLSYIDSSDIIYKVKNSWLRLLTQNTHQTIIAGRADLLIFKLDSAGYLKWGTLYGGSSGEGGNAIYAKDGFVYIGGQTNSSDKISTIGPGSRSLTDAFVAKLNAKDGKRIFGVYIAGLEGIECVSDIAADKDGNVYVCGSTSAKSGISTGGAIRTKPYSSSTSDWDGYLIKYDKTGKKKWGTYYRTTSSLDIIKNVAVDKNGSVFIFSSSLDKNGTEKSIDSTYISRFDSLGKIVWEVKLKDSLPLSVPYLDNYGSKLIYSTSWMHLDENGNIAIGGYLNVYNTYATGFKDVYYHSIFPTSDALKKKQEGEDGYFLLYNSKGERKYATLFGGKYHDKVRFASGDGFGGFYLGGQTYGNDIHTKDAYDTTSQYDYGYADGFLARLKFNLPEEAGIGNVYESEIKPVCENSNAILKLWIKNNGWKKIDSLKFNWEIDDTLQKTFNWTGFVPAGDSIIYSFKAPIIKAGKHNVKIWISNGDAKNDTITFSFTVNAMPPLSAGSNKKICNGEKIKLGTSAQNGLHYQWNTATNLVDTLSQIQVSPLQTTTYYVSVTNVKTGCAVSDSVTITVNPLPEKRAGNDKIICAGETVQLGDTSRSNYTYFWSTISGFLDSVAQPIVLPNQTTTYYLTVTDTTGCFMQDTVEVKVNPLPQIQSIFGEKYICKNGASWYSYKKDKNETIRWQVNGGSFIGKEDADSILVKWDSAGKYTIHVNVSTSSSCSDSNYLPVEVYPRIAPAFAISANSACINEPIIFSNKTNAATDIKWILPDGTIDTSQRITKAFSSPGIYAIWLKSITVNGCADSVKQDVTIYDLPGKEWQITSSKPGEVSFKAVDSMQTFYRWYFGTGDSAINANANYIYTKNGKYLVSLKIKNSNGCEIQRDTTLDVAGIVSVKENNKAPLSLNVYPNPFKEQTIIEYYLNEASIVNISIIDINGRSKIFVQQSKQLPGSHQFAVDSKKYQLPAGIYFIKIEADGIPAYKKIVKLK